MSTNLHAALIAEKDRAQKVLNRVSALFKSPELSPEYPPKHRYRLRGVSTKPHITYVPYEPKELVDISTEESTEGSQWWRLEYTNQPKITKTVRISICQLRLAHSPRIRY